jgi:hypothetical protein
MTREEVQGPPELELFDCYICGKPVVTLWAAGHQGMLSSEDSFLIGDEIVHTVCWDKMLDELPDDPFAI